jgi:hypothetical protein
VNFKENIFAMEEKIFKVSAGMPLQFGRECCLKTCTDELHVYELSPTKNYLVLWSILKRGEY